MICSSELEWFTGGGGYGGFGNGGGHSHMTCPELLNLRFIGLPV